MGFEKEKIRQIRNLLFWAAALILGIIYIGNIFSGLKVLVGILMPFLIGGAMAFVLNIPMSFYERTLLKSKRCEKIRRPVSIILSIISIVVVFFAVIMIVVPQIGQTISGLAKTIPVFYARVFTELEVLFASNSEIMELLNDFEASSINWQEIFSSIVDFAKNGFGNVFVSTVSLATSVIGGVTNFVIAFVFALYILAQKEELGSQLKRTLRAYLPNKAYKLTIKVCKLLNKNFHNFITGQCTEAVILGTMFVIVMTIFRLPYAVMIGVLIAFTALIPIVGAFIGCAVGAFLILMVSPIKAVIFIVIFLTLQQIEGNLIYPKVVGGSVGLPAIWVLAAVTVGGSLMGLVGMLIFIPLVSTGYALIREDVNKRNVKISEISNAERKKKDNSVELDVINIEKNDIEKL